MLLNTIINMYSVFWEEGEAFNHFTSLQVNKITCEQRHFGSVENKIFSIEILLEKSYC